MFTCYFRIRSIVIQYAITQTDATHECIRRGLKQIRRDVTYTLVSRQETKRRLAVATGTICARRAEYVKPYLDPSRTAPTFLETRYLDSCGTLFALVKIILIRINPNFTVYHTRHLVRYIIETRANPYTQDSDDPGV